MMSHSRFPPFLVFDCMEIMKRTKEKKWKGRAYYKLYISRVSVSTELIGSNNLHLRKVGILYSEIFILIFISTLNN